jgi:hypothetical protein
VGWGRRPPRIDFFGHLRHSTGEWANRPFDLQPWQAFVIGSLFGWKRADGLRRFRTAYVEVARKNGKSVMLAPSPVSGVQTLGGLVSHCWIEGEIEQFPGVLDGIAKAIVPVKILVP